MMSPTWAATWWEVFGGVDGRSLRLGLVRDGGRLVGLAPFVARTHWYGGALPFRRIELVGTGEPREDEICSEYVGVLAAGGEEHAVAEAVATALARGQFGAFDEVCLPAMNAGTPMPEALAGALRQRGLDVTIVAEADAAIAVLQPTWDAWLATLPGRRRYVVTRSLRDFDRWAGGTARVEVVTTEADLERAREALVELHEARWSRSERAHGAFRSARFREFHARVMPRLLKEGALDLSVLSAHGRPVGVLYAIRWAGRVAYYQSGRRVDLPDGVRPGIVLHAHAIRRAIDAGCREYDLLGGSSQFKRTLAQGSRTLVRLRATRPGLLEAARRVGTQQVRRARGLWASLRGAREPAAPRDDGD
jgi:CelD/BcsL family acetyltransferase involved in cellulose biosynthesis